MNEANPGLRSMNETVLIVVMLGSLATLAPERAEGPPPVRVTPAGRQTDLQFAEPPATVRNLREGDIEMATADVSAGGLSAVRRNSAATILRSRFSLHMKLNCEGIRLAAVTLVKVIESDASRVITVLAPD